MTLSRDVAEIRDQILDWRMLRSAGERLERVRAKPWRRTAEWGCYYGRRAYSSLAHRYWLRSVDSYRQIVLNPTSLVSDPKLNELVPNLDRLIRKRALFRGVVSGLREYYHPWGEFTPNAPIREVFEAAGITINPPDGSMNNDVKTPGVAVWKEDSIDREPPVIMIRPDVPKGWHPFILFHELFHLVSESGLGLCDSRSTSVVEILADRFASEMLVPQPVLAFHSSNSHFRWITSTNTNADSIIRTTSRQVFQINITTDVRNNEIARTIVQSPLNHHCSLSLDLLVDSVKRYSFPDYILLSSKCILSAIPLTDTSQNNNVLSFLTRDGLYHTTEGGNIIRNQLIDDGVLDNLGESPEIRTIRRIDLGDFSIGGNQFALFSWPTKSTTLGPVISTRHHRDVMAVECGYGSAERSWMADIQESRPVPLFPPEDPLMYSQPASFEAWVRLIERAFLDGPTVINTEGHPEQDANPFFRR